MFINNINSHSFLKNEADKNSDKDSEILRKVLDIFNEEDSLIDIYTRLNANENLELTDNYDTYKLGNIELIAGSSFFLEGIKTNLSLLNHYKMSCAQEFVASNSTKSGKYMIIAVKSSENLKEYEKNKDTVSMEEKSKFYEQNKKFSTETNLYNPLIKNSLEHWYIKDDGAIYIDDWSALEKFESKDELNSYLNTLRELLGLVYG